MQVVGGDPRVGALLAGYRIESLLGRGGMSVVYLAEDARLKRKVALKLLAANLAEDESFRERFLRESELAASIDHPNIVPIYEAGETDGLLFIAMRYVEGRDLKERLRRGRLEPREAIAILAQVASALDAAHARGLVHRDVKPSNVLLDPGARPEGADHAYLADFGLTQRLAEESRPTGDGHLMGTIDYVAPEQISGEDVDARADVYSLGCLLYECLAGEPPFRRVSDLAVVYAHLEEQPPSLSEHRPELPAALDAVVARALAKDPAERQQTCRELARAALAVTIDEASRLLADAASRAAAGRSDLTVVEAELAGKVIELQLAREQAGEWGRYATPARAAAEGVCPFKGLASFEPVDADYFFGRERLVAELVAHLVGTNLLAIVGPSGSGKSSVLRAGLLPALAGGVLPGSGSWRRGLLRPGERPLEELRRILVSGAGDPVEETLAALGPGERLFLAIDQLEEIFTVCRSEDERAAFAQTIAGAAADPQGRALVAVAIRADFYGRFAAYPALADLLGANHVLVGTMRASELRRAIELPASRVGLAAEPELVSALVDDVGDEPGALPLLSTALLELWQKRTDRTLTLAAYRESGGVHGAVARLAESTYERVPDEHKPLVRAVILRLVGEGEGEAAVRRRASLAELDLERNEDAARVLSTLADSRLVTVGEGTVEVAHEALLREWPRLRDWIEEDAQGRRLRRHITQVAIEWDAAGREEGELYRGARLAAALDWSANHALELNELERTFVTESREASERETKRARRTNRRLRVLLGGVATFLAVAVAGGVVAVLQRGEAREAADAARAAETAQLAQRLGAQALVEEDLDRSLLLARQAVAIDDSPQTRSYLLADLLRAPAAVGIMHGEDDFLRAVAISPDGKTLAVGPTFAGLHLFDTETYEQIGESWPEPLFVVSLAYSRDGRTLVMGGNGLRLVDPRTRRVLAEATDVVADRIAFTNDGSLLVVISGEGTETSLAFLDPVSLEPVGNPIHLEGFTTSFVASFPEAPHFALTPDGASVVTASDEGELAFWDLRSREQTRTLEIAKGHHALALTPDGLTAAVGIDRGIQLVDLRTGALRTFAGALTGEPSWLLFSPDGETLVSTSLDGAVTLWDARSGTPRETLRGHSDSAQQPVFSPDGETLYTASHDGTVIAWDVSGDRGLGRPFRVPPSPAFFYPAEFSPEGGLIAVGLEEGVGLWDAHRLTADDPVTLPTAAPVTALSFGPDGQTLTAVTEAGEAVLWDIASRSLHGEPLLVGPVANASVSADGSMLATAGTTGVDFWDLRTGAALGGIEGSGPAGDVAFSPNGALLAFVRETGPDAGDAEVWDVAGRSRLARLNVDSGIEGEIWGYAVAFSPDGRLLATGGLDPVVHIWDVGTGKLVRELDQGGAGVASLEFSADGGILAISGFEPVATLWDVASGTQLGPRLTAGNGRATIDFSSDGRRLLLLHGNGQGAVWDVDPESWQRRACALANRRLMLEEWDQYLPGRRYEPACA